MVVAPVAIRVVAIPEVSGAGPTEDSVPRDNAPPQSIATCVPTAWRKAIVARVALPWYMDLLANTIAMLVLLYLALRRAAIPVRAR